jgi:hypothetical protein
MIVRASNSSITVATLGPMSVRCPACRQLGTFDRVPISQAGQQIYDVQITSPDVACVTGQRLCPNQSCRAVLFFIWDSRLGKLAISYPAERLDFDTTNIPATIVKALEEAITCHANECFTASAIMVRKTLEELCHDRQAVGANLKERLRNLGTKIVLPQDLLEGLGDLRLLGNDAAHIESQEFNAIGREEVEIGIQFAKEVLKAVFQYADLLAKLRSLKRKP